MDNSDEILKNFNLAHYFCKRGDYEQTRPYLEAVLNRTDPSDDHACQLYWEYSFCLYKLGECAEALTKVEEGLSQYPDCRELYYIKGQIYYEMGLLRHSRDYFSKFITIKTSFLNCEDEMDLNYKAYGYLTAIAVRDGKYEDALYYLRLFILEKPDISAFTELCLLLFKSGIDKYTLIDILEASDTISELALVQFLMTSREYAACLDIIKRLGKENQLRSEWIQCQLYLGRYDQVQQMINGTIPLTPMGQDMLIHYCVSRWLEVPRRDCRGFLLKMDANLAEFQACLWVEELIFNHIFSPIQITEVNIDHMINTIALTIYVLGDTCLALDIVQNYFSCNRKEAYIDLGREAFDKGFFNEAKTLLERGVSQDDEKAEDCIRLGVVCGGFGLYEQALEYFLRAAALEPEKKVYPCLVFEALAIQEIEILVEKLALFIENPKLKSELLRLCSLKCKSRRLRQIIKQQGNDGKRADSIYRHFDKWSLVYHMNKEAVWKANG